MSRGALVPALAGLAVALVTPVALLGLDGNDGGGSEGGATTPGTVDAASGGAVFARMGCGGYHSFGPAGSKGDLGPSLDRLEGYTRETLISRIVNPPFESPMPPGFGKRMTRRELRTLADFLLAKR